MPNVDNPKIKMQPLLDEPSMIFQRVAETGRETTRYYVSYSEAILELSLKCTGESIGYVKVNHPVIMWGTNAEVHGDIRHIVERKLDEAGILDVAEYPANSLTAKGIARTGLTLNQLEWRTGLRLR